MQIVEYLDSDCDAKMILQTNGSMDGPMLTFTYEGTDTEVRVYKDGIKILTDILLFAEKNNLLGD